MRKTISFLRGMVTTGILTGQPWTTQGFDPKECDGKWMVLAMSDKGKTSWNYLKHNPRNGLFEAELDLPSKNDVHIMLYCEGVNRSEDDKQMQSQYNKIKQETGNAVTDEQLDQCFAPKNMIPFGGIYFNTSQLSQNQKTASIVNMREDIYCKLTSPEHDSVNSQDKMTKIIDNELTKISVNIEKKLDKIQKNKQVVLEKMYGVEEAQRLKNMASSVSFTENSAASWAQGSGLPKLPPFMYEQITNTQLNNTIHRQAVNVLEAMVRSMMNRDIDIESISKQRLFQELDKHIAHNVCTNYNYTFDETLMPEPGTTLDPEKKVIMGDQAKAGGGIYLASLLHFRSQMSSSIAAISALQHQNAAWNSVTLKNHFNHCVWMLVSKSEQDIHTDCEDQADKQKAMLRSFVDHKEIDNEIDIRASKRFKSIGKKLAKNRIINDQFHQNLTRNMKLVATLLSENIEVTDIGLQTGDGYVRGSALVLASGAKLDRPQLPGIQPQQYDKSDVIEVMNRLPSTAGGHCQLEVSEMRAEKYYSKEGIKVVKMKHIADDEGTGGTVIKEIENQLSNTLNREMKMQVVANASSCSSLETVGKVNMINKALQKYCITGNAEKIICTMSQLTAQLALSNVPNIKMTQFIDRASDNFSKVICNNCGLSVVSTNSKGEVQDNASNVISGSEYQIMVHKKGAEYCRLMETAANLFRNVYATRIDVDRVQTEMFDCMNNANINTTIPSYTNSGQMGTNAWDKWPADRIVADVECNRSPFETVEEFSEYIGQVSSIDEKNIHIIPGHFSGPRGLATSKRVIITS